MVSQTHLVYLLPTVFLFCIAGAEAAAFQGGHLTGAIHDVRLLEPHGGWSPAAANAPFNDGSIQTGTNSRAEISFQDQTVVRFGDNTLANVEPKTRTVELTSGAILTQVPSGVGSTKVKVRRITATTTGTTIAVESLPKAYIKFLVLDGTSRLCLKRGTWVSDCVLLRAGQMLIVGPDAKDLPESVDVDLNRLIDTCQFITEFPKLPHQERLTKAAAAQSKSKSHGRFTDTNLTIFGRGTLVSVKKAGNDATAGQSNAKEATPTPSPKRNPTP